MDVDAMIANFEPARSEINIAIADKPPEQYFRRGRRPVQRWQEEVRRHARVRTTCREPESARALSSGVTARRLPAYEDFLGSVVSSPSEDQTWFRDSL